MDKELKKEFKELKLNSLESKQESMMGSIDSIFIALSLFFISLMIAIDFSSLVKSLSKIGSFGEILIVWAIYFAVLIPPLIYAIFQYPLSVFSDKGRFNTKINVFTILYGALTFLGFLFLLLICVWGLERLGLILPMILLAILMGGILIASFIITIFSTRKKIKKYFLDKFPTIIFKKINSMDKEEREKNLKNLGITFSELKRRAEGYKAKENKKLERFDIRRI